MNRDRNCLPSGALNVSACRFGAPAFVTLPHMLNTDPYYPSKISGLHPMPEHNFRLALEMFTGMPLAVTAQLQINLLVRHVAGITGFYKSYGDNAIGYVQIKRDGELCTVKGRVLRSINGGADPLEGGEAPSEGGEVEARKPRRHHRHHTPPQPPLTPQTPDGDPTNDVNKFLLDSSHLGIS
ncbi:hypothetical protein evm_015245, partial [Chilo suppressalis]